MSRIGNTQTRIHILPPQPARGSRDSVAVTRAGTACGATVASLILLVLLITFIVQDQEDVTIVFFGLGGTVASGVALLIAAVGGGLLVAVAGAAGSSSSDPAAATTGTATVRIAPQPASPASCLRCPGSIEQMLDRP